MLVHRKYGLPVEIRRKSTYRSIHNNIQFSTYTYTHNFQADMAS